MRRHEFAWLGTAGLLPMVVAGASSSSAAPTSPTAGAPKPEASPVAAKPPAPPSPSTAGGEPALRVQQPPQPLIPQQAAAPAAPAAAQPPAVAPARSPQPLGGATAAAPSSPIQAVAPPGAAQAPTMQFRFRGELVDDQNRPISAVLPMTFQVFGEAGSANPILTERLPVAVTEGVYTVTLGTTTAISPVYEGRQVLISAGINDRDQSQPVPWLPRLNLERADGELPVLARGYSFADVADRAASANRALLAENCRTLGGKSATEIDRYDELAARVNELREQMKQRTTASLGTNSQTLERAGGSGGNPYQRQCPPGFVMTGIRGGQGQFLDSIEVVCSAIE